MKKVQDSGWTVETEINDKSAAATIGRGNYNVRSLIQFITAPDGSKIQLEQLLDNNGDMHDITVRKLK
ncbi:hypothetical protein [Cochleicola gelatinilyticus]|uniref:Uncharacterized protein n=1 Tax=Cochleicola gelatinilyticus TaxID=1763537 RepID=A0A167HM65_9FLAO|nr:hypothetical protein [Cochleicola gelatinilyticus]OAB78762.1 hypothetical protein ULVI_09275 [Cochleicola gelatinilyticus]